ncbi:MAG: hypothetical protein U9R51_10650 [Actinomycetota bacterium]|nr:hypothetical protein [Actinomycetota bacterium]
MTAGEWYVAIVPLVVGFGVLGFWAAALLGRNVPEITSGGIEIWFHIVAEAATAMLLIAGGVAVLVDAAASWSITLSALGLGMLTYTLIVSPGYYVERRNASAVIMFGGLWLLTLPAIILRFVIV